jgi:hypothetical protein
MWRKICLGFWLAILLVSLPLSLSGCATAIPAPPRVTVCVLDGENSVLGCHDPVAGNFVLSVSEAERFLCLPPDSAKELITYLRLLSNVR